MPMSILFFGFLAVVFLNEIEECLKQKGNIDFVYVLCFPVARQSLAIIAGFFVFGALFVLEMKYFFGGQIYLNTPHFEGVVRAAIIILLSFLAVGYKAICLGDKGLEGYEKKIKLIKLTLVIFGASLSAIFLFLQFKFIFR